MKKYISFVLVFSILFCSIVVCVSASNQTEISMEEFYSQLDKMALCYEEANLSTEKIEDIPLNRLIVKTKDNSPLKNYYDAAGIVEGYDGLHILQYSEEIDAAYAYGKLLSDEIEYVEYDYYLETTVPTEYSGTTELGQTHISWNSDAVKVDDAFEYIKSKDIECNEVIVAVIDSGIHSKHEFFVNSGRIKDSGFYYEVTVGLDSEGEKITEKQPSMEDDAFHGTAVSSVVLDNTMSNVLISPYRVTNSMFIRYSNMFKAFDFAVSEKVDVINISAGGGIPSESKTLYNKIKSAAQNGITVVVASGNENNLTDAVFPACHPNVITVSATDENSIPTAISNFGNAVDVSAPGANIKTPVPRLLTDNSDNEPYPAYNAYMIANGTSYATPLVAAAAATLKSIKPELSSYEIQRIIKETAYVPENWDESCAGKNYGTGIVNFYNMVKAVLEPEYSVTPTIKVNSDNKFEIVAPEGTDARIYYTLDGSVPTIDNHLTYTEPFNLRNSYKEKLIAVCHENGKLIGEPVSYDLVTEKTKTIFYKWSTNPLLNEDSEMLSYKINDPSIAAVDDEGNITGLSLGDTKITYYMASGKRVVCDVNVIYAPWQWIIIILFGGFLWY